MSDVIYVILSYFVLAAATWITASFSFKRKIKYLENLLESVKESNEKLFELNTQLLDDVDYYKDSHVTQQKALNESRFLQQQLQNQIAELEKQKTPLNKTQLFVQKFKEAGFHSITVTTAEHGHIIVKNNGIVLNFYPTTETFFINRQFTVDRKPIKGSGFDKAVKHLTVKR